MTKRKLSRRDFLQMSALFTAGGILAACTPEVITEIVEVEVTSVGAMPAIVDVTVFVYAGQIEQADSFAEGALYTVHLMNYNLQDGRHARVHYEALPGGDEYNTKIRLMTSSGELNDHILWGSWGAIYNWVKDGLVLNLDGLMEANSVTKDEWTEGAQSAIRYDPDTGTPGIGPVWGLPYFALPGNAFLFTNVDMLKAAGVNTMPNDDMTEEELQDIAEKVKVKYPDAGIFGMSFVFYGNQYHLNSTHEYVRPFGGRSMSEDGTKAMINSPECLESFQWQSEVVKMGLSPTPDQSEAMGHRGGAAEGKLAMYRQGPWGGSWITARAENKDPEMLYTLYPSSHDGRANTGTGCALGIDWFGISSLAVNPDELFDVLYWLTGPEAGEFVITAGRSSPMPRIDALNSPLLDDFPFMKATSKSMLSTEPPLRAANLREGEVSDLIAQRFSTFATGETPMDQAFLDQVADEMQEILDMPPA